MQYSKVRLVFFNIFEKTQAQKNSRFEKTQGNFSPKLSETVVMVVTYILEIIFLCSKLTNILKIAQKTQHTHWNINFLPKEGLLTRKKYAAL